MIVETGHYALVLALVLALLQVGVPLAGVKLRDAALMNVGRSAASMQFLLVAWAFAALTWANVNSDFSVLNVFENSHSLKPLLYKVTGVWGNHEGSMLLWVLILALFGALVAVFGGNLTLQLRALVLSVQAMVASAFYLFILFTSNPFLRIADPPIEGRDLNPVLQDIGLALHPPLLYLGYVGFSISFSFAVAALIDGRIDAACFSLADQQAMIRGMVDGLAAKLKQDGSDPNGWLRLIRAYIVLGERDKAELALDEARAAVPDAEKLRVVNEGARSFGLN